MKTGKFIAVFLSVAIFVIMPLVVSLKLQDMEMSPRHFTLSLILLFSTAAILFFTKAGNYFLTANAFLTVATVFVAVLLFSFARTLNYGEGLYEITRLLLFGVLLINFTILLRLDSSFKYIFFKGIIVSVLLFIGYGIFQLIMRKGAFEINYALSSTLGNKNFFSETLLLMFPVTMASIKLLKTLTWRIAAVVSSVLIIVTIILLQTLSAWVAAGVAILVVTVIAFRHHKVIFQTAGAYRKFYLIVSAALIVSVAGVVTSAGLGGRELLSTRIDTFKSMLEPGSGRNVNTQNSTYERIFLWKNSLKIIRDYPLEGAGLANWKIIMPSYGMENAVYMTGGGIRFVHPHNDYLLVASESGIPGLLIFLTLAGMVFIFAYRNLKSSESRDEIFLNLGIFAGLTVYFTVSLFSLPSARIYPVIMLIIFTALIIHQYYQRVGLKGKRMVSLKWIFVCAILIALGSSWLGYKRLVSEYHVANALYQDQKRNYNMMKRHIEKIDRKYYPLDVTATPIAWFAGYANFYTGEREKAFELFKEAEKVNPFHLMVLNDLGTSYNLKGDPATAESYYRKALGIQPDFGSSLVNLAIIQFNAGKKDEAYTTIVRHRGKINRESVVAFSTIISAKAATITTDTATLNRLSARMKNEFHLYKLLDEIQSSESGISTILKGYR